MDLLATFQIALAQSAPAAQSAASDDTQWMVYAILAFGIAITLLILEAFLPSGGVLGLLACFCAVASIVMFFMFDDMWGMVSMAISLLAAPFVIGAMLWVWPNTPIGRALTLENEQQLVNTNPQDSEADGSIHVGLEGEALTDLRPVGACRLDGQRIDCTSSAGVIEKGTKVRVIGVEGISIKVKAL